MATYYVSQQVGSDLNTGNGPGTGQAWATVGKALASGVAAGNTIYIGPGTYRESTVTPAVSGGASTHIRWVGDPTCQYLTSDKPGRVRITRADSGDVPQTGSVFDLSGVSYHDLSNLYLDGSSNTATVFLGSNDTLTDCVVINGYNYAVSASGGTVTRCYAMSIDRAVYATAATPVFTDCVFTGGTGVGGSAAGYGTFNNCIVLGGSGSVAFRNTVCNNCLAIGGGTYGYRQVTANNCVAIGFNGAGFYGAGTDTTLRNCSAFYCTTGFVGTAGNLLDVSTACKYGACPTGQDVNCTGTATATAPPLLNLFDVRKVLEPWLLPTRNDGSNTYVPATDILGRPRPLGSGTCDRGPWEWPNESVDWTVYETTAPGIKLTRAGQTLFYVPVKDGQTVTVTAQTKWVNTNTSLKPQLILRGTGITTQTSTNTANSNVWQSLQVSAAATEDALLEIVFYARDTGTAAAVAYLSDLEVNVA